MRFRETRFIVARTCTGKLGIIRGGVNIRGTPLGGHFSRPKQVVGVGIMLFKDYLLSCSKEFKLNGAEYIWSGVLSNSLTSSI